MVLHQSQDKSCFLLTFPSLGCIQEFYDVQECMGDITETGLILLSFHFLLGCIKEFYDVQECMGDHRDWRACQDKVKAMRECMAKHEKAVAEKVLSSIPGGVFAPYRCAPLGF